MLNTSKQSLTIRFCDNKDYYIPKVESLEAYRAYVDSLDITDDPSVFEMHKNANMSYQTQETEKLLKTILKINPSKSSRYTQSNFSGGGGGSDQIVEQYCETLLNPEEGIPNMIKLEAIREELTLLDERKLYPPLTTVLFQEVERFNTLIMIIQDSLEKLVCAIKGTIIMSAVLDDVYYSLLNNQVPKLWTANAYPSLKPLYSWVKDLSKRIAFMQKWVIEGKPARFDLPYFFFPQGFLTGVLQTYSRAFKKPIDTLKFEFRVIDPDKDTSKEDPLDQGAVLITGLYLEGTRWDRKRRSLQDQFEGIIF